MVVRMVSILSLKKRGQAKRKTSNAATVPHCRLELKIAISCA
jgi:hypothetical protein